MDKCPLNEDRKVETKPKDAREGKGNRYDGKRNEDRARSYKGVVINGEEGQGQQGKGKEGETVEYQGKGKGKMYKEVDDSQRSRKGDKEYKKNTFYNGGLRRDEESSRIRKGMQWKAPKASIKEQRPFTRVDPSLMVEEEGEIREPVNQESPKPVEDSAPSAEFQMELMKTQATPPRKPHHPEEPTVQNEEALAPGETGDEEEAMEFDDQFRVMMLEGKVDESFQDLTDEESEGVQQLQESNLELNEQDKAGDKEGDGGKKQGNKKRMLKPPPALTAGSSKMRLAQQLASPRKRYGGKTEARKGEGNKQDGKGSSIPKPGPPLP